MAFRKPRRNAGVSRIDQPEKRTHGFFVRLCRKGKIHNAFFTDLKYGGKRKALAAARRHYRKLLRKHGEISRRDWAQIPRHKTGSGIVGVMRASKGRGRKARWYWMAMWSPRRGVQERRTFSMHKYGARKARALAIKARMAGLRRMVD
jgi:hypothetical protein